MCRRCGGTVANAVCYHPRMRNRLANMRRNCTRGAYLAPLLGLRARSHAATALRRDTSNSPIAGCRSSPPPRTARPSRSRKIAPRPADAEIAIAVTVLPANTLSPKADPLFMLAGGPGQSAAALAPLAGMLGGVRRNRDIVLIDPRGTGKSAPLQCAALAPRDPFDDFSNVDVADAAQRCLREIKAAGERRRCAIHDSGARRRYRCGARGARLRAHQPVGRLLRHARRAGISAPLPAARAQRWCSTASRRRPCASASMSGRRARPRWRSCSPHAPNNRHASARIPISTRRWPRSARTSARDDGERRRSAHRRDARSAR